MSKRVSVASADFIRNIGHWQNQALREPISITHHGRERLVLARPEEFDRQDAKAEAEAKPSDADMVLEHLEDGFLAFDASLNVTRINVVAVAFIGRGREAVLGAAAGDLPAPICALRERLARVMHTRKLERCETVVGDRHISVRVIPLSEGVAMLFANTTELHDQRARLGLGAALWAATEQQPGAAATLDAHGRVTAVQRGFCDWLGFERDEFVGQFLLDMAPADQSRRVNEAFERALAATTPQQVAVALIGKDGRAVRGTLTLAAIRSDAMSSGVVAVMAPDPEVIDQSLQCGCANRIQFEGAL